MRSEINPCFNCYGSLDLNLFSGHARLAGPAKMSNSVWWRFCTTLVLSTLHLSTTKAIGDQQGKKKKSLGGKSPALEDPSNFSYSFHINSKGSWNETYALSVHNPFYIRVVLPKWLPKIPYAASSGSKKVLLTRM